MPRTKVLHVDDAGTILTTYPNRVKQSFAEESFMITTSDNYQEIKLECIANHAGFETVSGVTNIVDRGWKESCNSNFGYVR